MSMFVIKVVNAVSTVVMKIWAAVVEQEMQDTEGVVKPEDTSELHQLKQRLWEANETISGLLEQQLQS